MRDRGGSAGLRPKLSIVKTKMRQKSITLSCETEAAQHLAEAVRAYAHAAFPPGGSECAQVSREALLDTASHCDTHPGGELALRKRQMPQIRAAVRWYFSDEGPGTVTEGERLSTLLSRN